MKEKPATALNENHFKRDCYSHKCHLSKIVFARKQSLLWKMPCCMTASLLKIRIFITCLGKKNLHAYFFLCVILHSDAEIFALSPLMLHFITISVCSRAINVECLVFGRSNRFGTPETIPYRYHICGYYTLHWAFFHITFGIRHIACKPIVWTRKESERKKNLEPNVILKQ